MKILTSPSLDAIVKSTRCNASIFLRAIAVVCSLALIALIGAGTLTKARPGTWIDGPVAEFWAITIAISNVNFGLEGGLGYVQIYQKLHSFFSASADPFEIDHAEALGDPHFNNHVVKAAGGMRRGDVKGGVVAEGDYLLYATDDIGYAFFYMMAFKLFGISAFATHYFYCLILVVSFVVFVVDVVAQQRCYCACSHHYRRDFFGRQLRRDLLGSPGSGEQPLSYDVGATAHAAFADRDLGSRTAYLLSGAGVALQAFVLACAIWFRSSAAWASLAILISAAVMIIRTRPVRIVLCRSLGTQCVA